MKLRVTAIALALAAASLVGGGSAAFADDDDHEDLPVSGSTEHQKPHHPHPEEDELHERYGDDIGQVNLPPLVVKHQPTTGNANLGGADQISSTTDNKLVDAGTADPSGNLPVDPSNINPNQGTPADDFFNSATVGLGAMGAGVLALGGVAVRRSIKLRKDPKADFLYQ